jgi:hypothetical protein
MTSSLLADGRPAVSGDSYQWASRAARTVATRHLLPGRGAARPVRAACSCSRCRRAGVGRRRASRRHWRRRCGQASLESPQRAVAALGVASCARRVARPRCRRDFIAARLRPSACAVAVPDRPWMSRRTRTARCSGASPAMESTIRSISIRARATSSAEGSLAAAEIGVRSRSRDLRMHSLRTIWNIHDASAAAVRSVPIFRYRTIRASCAASSASSGFEQSVRAKRRTCACEPETSVAIARGSPCWAALMTCSAGQDREGVLDTWDRSPADAKRILQDRDGTPQSSCARRRYQTDEPSQRAAAPRRRPRRGPDRAGRAVRADRGASRAQPRRVRRRRGSDPLRRLGLRRGDGRLRRAVPRARRPDRPGAGGVAVPRGRPELRRGRRNPRVDQRIARAERAERALPVSLPRGVRRGRAAGPAPRAPLPREHVARRADRRARDRRARSGGAGDARLPDAPGRRRADGARGRLPARGRAASRRGRHDAGARRLARVPLVPRDRARVPADGGRRRCVPVPGSPRELCGRDAA